MQTLRTLLVVLAVGLLASLASAQPSTRVPGPASLAPVTSAPRSTQDDFEFRTPQTVERIRAELDEAALPLWTKYDVRLDGRSIDVLVWMPHATGYDTSSAAAKTCQAVFEAVAEATNERWAKQNATPAGRSRWHTYVLAGERSGMCDYTQISG
jgi:hypothetical protein